MSVKFTYTEPALCHYNYDLSKSWFVYFDVVNADTGKQLRKQFRGGINYNLTKRDRIKAGNDLAQLWKNKLEKNLYAPFEPTSADKVEMSADAPKTVKSGVDLVCTLKKASLKPSSVRTYDNISKMFNAWCAVKRFDILPLHLFGKAMAQRYCDYLLLVKKYNGKTHNNQVNVLKAIFGELKRRYPEHVGVNPFVSITALPTDIGGNIAYSKAEQQKLIPYFRENNKRLYYAVQFMFHSFIRKTELTCLRVGDIDWENGTITINSQSAKSRRQDSITVTEGLLPILYEMGLDLAPKHFYIFGYQMQTTERKMGKSDYLSDAHLTEKIKAGLPKNDGKSFYSWKHTGVVAYWFVIKDPYYMMRQLRHSDLQTTMIYLKSLGLMPNEAFKKACIIL